jgi:2-phospho-L-lactate guanylyltransferase
VKAWAVVPVKRFAAAKSRLADVLDGNERARLARAMFEHVLGVLTASEDVAGITVVTDSPEIEAEATARGAMALSDPTGAASLGALVDHALSEVAGHADGPALVLMGDLPDITALDIRQIVRELERVDVVVVRDARGDHTNALGLHLKTRWPTWFGHPNSFRRHSDGAARAGLSVSVPELPGIAFDIDTPEDYARLLRARQRAG